MVEIFHSSPTSETPQLGSGSAATGGGDGGISPARTVLWDRKTDGGFPETKELKRRVRDVIEPGRDLGHVDRNHARPNTTTTTNTSTAAAAATAGEPTTAATADGPRQQQQPQKDKPSRAELEAAGAAGAGYPGASEAAAEATAAAAACESKKECEDCD